MVQEAHGQLNSETYHEAEKAHVYAQEAAKLAIDLAVHLSELSPSDAPGHELPVPSNWRKQNCWAIGSPAFAKSIICTAIRRADPRTAAHSPLWPSEVLVRDLKLLNLHKIFDLLPTSGSGPRSLPIALESRLHYAQSKQNLRSDGVRVAF